jgi:hypothetical protein
MIKEHLAYCEFMFRLENGLKDKDKQLNAARESEAKLLIEMKKLRYGNR